MAEEVSSSFWWQKVGELELKVSWLVPKGSSHPKVPSSREVLSVFMERHSHDPVCGIEGLFHAIAMVNINVNIQHPLVIPTIRRWSGAWGVFGDGTRQGRQVPAYRASCLPQVSLSTRDVETG